MPPGVPPYFAHRSGARLKPRGIEVHVCKSLGDAAASWAGPGPGHSQGLRKQSKDDRPCSKCLCGFVFHVHTEFPRTLLRDFYQLMFLQEVLEVSAPSYTVDPSHTVDAQSCSPS